MLVNPKKMHVLKNLNNIFKDNISTRTTKKFTASREETLSFLFFSKHFPIFNCISYLSRSYKHFECSKLQWSVMHVKYIQMINSYTLSLTSGGENSNLQHFSQEYNTLTSWAISDWWSDTYIKVQILNSHPSLVFGI